MRRELLVVVLVWAISFPPVPLHALNVGKVLSGAESATLVRETQQTPDGLGAARFDGLRFADPAAQIDLIQAPVANNQGDAGIAYPLSIPPGRGGMQPDLALNYSSSGGNGWLGLGWSLSVGEVGIDTRWGVPRYDSDEETETYLLDGEVLSPTAVRSALLDREGERMFKRRVEGEFERIQRHGDAPGSYWWEITDKSGTRRFYGGIPGPGRDPQAILADDSGHGFRWALRQIRDISNNTVTFSYATVDGSGVGADGLSIGRELYLSSILYTGTVAPGLPDDPAYEVRFVRSSQLNETIRPDVSIDARGGFLRVTSDLLRRVEVYYRGALTRLYTLNYREGAFRKTLLERIDQAGSDGVVFASHDLDYFDDVRPDGSTYQGFAPAARWSTGDDGVGDGIDLGAFGDGSASALGGVESLGGDHRAYIGFNVFKGDKSGSAGGAFVVKGGGGISRLELLDINGDNLPDKIFSLKGSDEVNYRLNTSGPNQVGPATFGPVGTVAGINKLSQETSFEFGVGVEAYFGINLLYNHAWTWSWGRSYFIDVNADGLVDFVDNGTVYFNSLDATGNPVFTQDSADTAVPIDGGALDPSALPNLSDVEAQQREQAPLQDTLRRWRAPWDGNVSIQGGIRLLPPDGGSAGDGVRVAIQHEGNELWATVVGGSDHTVKTPTGVSSIAVHRGDDIYFRVQSIDDGASDEVSWDPVITYLGVPATEDANGLDVYRYQASEDFTLGGRTGIFAVAPVDGTLRVEGDFTKFRKTTDDITIQILKNGTIVGSPITIGRDDTGTIDVLQDVDVLGGSAGPPPVLGDAVSLQLKIDSPVDLSAFSWSPRLFYVDNPVLDLNAPVDIQIYPRTDPAVPQVPWTASSTGSIALQTNLLFCASSSSPPCDLADGSVVVTVKKKVTPAAPGEPPAELVGKQVLTIVDGQITNVDPDPFTVDVEANAQYWFDLSVAQPVLGGAWTAGSVAMLDGTTTTELPSARHWAFIPDDVFPMSYRGWGFAGYNGDRDLASQPIVESNLIFNRSDYPEAGPQLTDPNNDFPTTNDVDPTYQNPAKGKAYVYAPFVAIDGATGSEVRQWRGPKDNIFGAAAGASSSRIGPDSVGLPGSDELLGASAVTRFSLTEADSFAASVGGALGGSFAWGTSRGLLDFLDMNGDQFPDIVGNGGVQYTTARGGLTESSTSQTVLDGNVRHDTSTSWSFDAGGTAAEIKADSKGNGNNAQAVRSSGGKQKRNSNGKGGTGSGRSGDDSQTGASLGLSGGVGRSSTNTGGAPFGEVLESELGDINGDGLPDRIRVYTGGRITAALNLGYAFSSPIEWPGGNFEQGESLAYHVGPNLGFSYGSLAFGGGVDLSSSHEESVSAWVDINGDGLLDQLRTRDRNTANQHVVVRLGTGAGLSGDIDWGTFRDGAIAKSENDGLGGGFDFTIGIGPLCYPTELCYIILNPGGHFGRGMSRQALELYDVNGDGYPDHVASAKEADVTSDNYMDVLLNTTGRSNLLKSVANPIGGTFELDYTRKGNTTSQAFSQWVLSRVAVDDGRPGDGPDIRLTTYEYEGNIYNALERDFLGYALVTERQRDAGTPGEPVLRSFERAYRNGTIFEKGLLERDTLLGPDGIPIKETLNGWRIVDATTGAVVNLSPDPAGVGLLGVAAFPQRPRIDHRWYDSGALAKSTYNTFAYDLLGNVVETFDAGEPALASDDLVARTTFTECTGSTWVSLPDSFEILHGGNVLRSRHAEVLCANGAVTKLWEDTGSGEALTELDFDPWGNYNHIVYPPNADGQRYEVSYTYDPDRHTDIAEVEDSYGLLGRATYDGPTGEIKSQTDANLQTTSYEYDDQGRLISIIGPYEQGTGHATVTFEYFPTAPDYAYGIAHHYDAFHPGDPIDSVRFIDGIGRETQTKQDATVFRGADQLPESVMVVSGAVEFDALGRAVREWYPIEEPLGNIGTYNANVDSVAPSLTSWTLTDLVTRVTAPDGSTTSTSYGFGQAEPAGPSLFLATQTDPLGNVRRSFSDVRDNLLAVELDHDGDTLRTTYNYDPLTQLVAVTDPAGSLTSHEYDLLGNRTATTTPDGGRIELEYDLASNVIARITPNLRATGGRISYHWDFDRLAGISYSDGTPGVTYVYGESGAPNNGAGRIVEVQDGSRTQTRGFGRLGEVTDETTTMLVHNLNDGTEGRLTWTTTSEYDTWGRLKALTYPDGELVSYDYDAGGLLRSVEGAKAGTVYPYVNREEYDKFFARRFLETGNGVGTETAFDPQTRRLAHQISDAPGRRVQDIAYSYDRVGNLLEAVNAAPVPVSSLMGGTSRQTFSYDDLYQLVSAEGIYNYSPNKQREYTFELTYDRLGNVTRKIQTDAVINNPRRRVLQQDTTYDQTYEYLAAPHQPTQIGQLAYTYDANGNLTGWDDSSSGQNRTVTWDAEDRLTSVADQGSTTRYTYDDEGRLAIERGPGGETAFVNRFYTVWNGTVAWKHIWAAGERIASKREMPEDELEQRRYFFQKDLLGSTNLVTDPSGQIFEHLEYFPSGETWVLEHSDIYRAPHLYGGGYFEEFRALYNFGARWYEPREQLFYSPDPALIQSPEAPIEDPALLAAYTYAENNPLRLVDRDGRTPEFSQDAFLAAFARRYGSGDPTQIKAAAARDLQAWAASVGFSDLVLKTAEPRFGKASRLLLRAAANPNVAKALKGFKAFVTYSAKPVVQVNFKRTGDGLQLKNVKVAPFLFKQFKVKRGRR